jgi:hypothetical protein
VEKVGLFGALTWEGAKQEGTTYHDLLGLKRIYPIVMYVHMLLNHTSMHDEREVISHGG